MSESASRLYHYTTSTGLIGIISDGKIWASEIGFLNDSQEFACAMDLIYALNDELYRARGTQSADIVRSKIESILTYAKNLISGVFVTSFSEEGNQLGQWRGYCPQGGFSIGFNSDYLMKNFSLHECIYDKDRQKEYLAESLLPVVDKLYAVLSPELTDFSTDTDYIRLAEEYNDAISAFVDAMKQCAPLIKHEKFHEEKEWRLYSSADLNEERVVFRPGKYQPIPYVQIDIKTDMIEQVVVGPTPEPQLAVRAVQALIRRYDLACDEIVVDVVPLRSW